MATQAETPERESNLESYLGWLTVVLGLSLPLYRPWVTLAASAFLVLWLVGGGITARIKRLRSHRLTIALLVFLALNMSSLLWTSNPRAGFRYVTKYRYLLLIPMVASTVRPIYRRYAVTAFELASGFSVALSVCISVGLFRFGDAHPGNPSPTMAHLDYGLLLALAALLTLTRVLYAEMSISRRILWSVLALVLIVGLVINIGRAGQLAFAGGLAMLLVHWGRGRRARLVVGVAAGLAITLLAAWFSFPMFQSRIHLAGTELRAAIVDHRYDSDLGGRVAALKVAREVFRESPVLGTGVGGNMAAFRRIIDSRFNELKSSIYWYRHYHNQYAQVATELGLAGLLSLAWIFWELIRVPGRRRETDAAALILTTVFLLGFLGEPFFHKQITLVMFSLFAGLVSAEQLFTRGGEDLPANTKSRKTEAQSLLDI